MSVVYAEETTAMPLYCIHSTDILPILVLGLVNSETITLRNTFLFKMQRYFLEA